MQITVIIIRAYCIYFDPENEMQVDCFLHGLMFVILVGAHLLFYFLGHLLYLVIFKEIKLNKKEKIKGDAGKDPEVDSISQQVHIVYITCFILGAFTIFIGIISIISTCFIYYVLFQMSEEEREEIIMEEESRRLNRRNQDDQIR